MIMIPVDEADAFDRISIASTKGEDWLYATLCLKVGEQITDEKFEEVKRSSEYKALKRANELTFKFVEKAKRNECSAQDVDRANYQRYLAKKALQEKFFPKSPLTETKTERPY